MTSSGFSEATKLSGFIQVCMDDRHGERLPGQTLKPSACPAYLHVSQEQVEQVGGLSLGVLGVWCRALSGQGGQLELLTSLTDVDTPQDAQELVDTNWFYRFTTKHFTLTQTIIPFTEIDPRNAGLSQMGESSGRSDALSLATLDGDDAPPELVTAFATQEPSGSSPATTSHRWRFLSKRSQTTFRSRLRLRDKQQCVFTHFDHPEAAHLVRRINPLWAIVHITCTRQPTSQLSIQELQTCEGVYDPRNGISLDAGLHTAYDQLRCLAPSIVGNFSLLVEWDGPHRLLQDVSHPQNYKDEITLRLEPLAEGGPRRIRTLAADPEAGETCTIVDFVEPSSQLPSRAFLPRASKSARLEAGPIVHGRPFDIYVEYGLGARLLSLYGTATALAKSQKSPLCVAYGQQPEQRAFQRAGL